MSAAAASMRAADASRSGDADLPVPGTQHLVDLETRRLRLIPTPSADPDDPLNWSPGRKALASLCWAVYVFFNSLANANLGSVLVPLSEARGLSVSTLNAGTGYLFLLAGWGLFVWQPLALQLGKRFVYVTSMLGIVAVTAWAPYCSTAGQWYGRAVLAGFFAAPVEALPELSIADLYFTHERGTYTGLYAFVLIGSNFAAPLICGFINVGQGWQWVFYYPAIFAGAAAVFLFLFMEETNFDRSGAAMGPQQQRQQQLSSSSSSSPHASATPPPVIDAEKETQNPGHGTFSSFFSRPAAAVAAVRDPSRFKTTTTTTTHAATKTWLQKLKPIHRRPRISLLFRHFRAQARFLLWPLPLLAGFLYGSCLIWFNVMNATASEILAAPPYRFSSSVVGLAYVAPLLGAAGAGAYVGYGSDLLARRLAARRGTFEPEHRLPPALLLCLVTPASLVLWGVGAARGVHWAGLLFAMAGLGFQNTVGASVAFAYLVDSYRELAGEAVTAVIVVRNTMSFAVNYGISAWVEDLGLQDCFVSAAMVGLGCSLTVAGLLWKGKRVRARSAGEYWRLVGEQQQEREQQGKVKEAR